MKVASRLSALYAALLGVTVLIVMIATSIALVAELSAFSQDIVIAKHEEARIMADRYHREGLPLSQGAPEIVAALSGIGMRVTVYDSKGRYLAGDKTLRPKVLDRILALGGFEHFIPHPVHPPHFIGPPLGPPPDSSRFDPMQVAPVQGGYVAFATSVWLLIVSLDPYWRIVLAIALGAMFVSWFIGRVFASQALKPINEVSTALHQLANGDYTQRRFVMQSGDEVASLTEAYNDAAASVASAMDDRRRAEGRMRQFAADASHELRTPLTVIGGYIDVLRRGAVEEPKIARQILATMSLEKEHMRSMIDRLMRLARLDSETEPRVEVIDVNAFLQGQVKAAHRLDDRRQIDYSVDNVETIDADPSELGEAVWNIIENALKYAPEAPIHLRASRNDGHVIISVRDEGPGMSESERVHAFERFYRGDERGEITGTGLGLAIAKRAVERAGGDISIDSAPGHGTTLTITLDASPDTYAPALATAPEQKRLGA
jgi:two-component system, OmpR family, sensor kinase